MLEILIQGKIDAYMGVVSQLRIDQLFLENTPIYVKMSIGSLEPQSRGIAMILYNNSYWI